jgi:predicted metal-binding protein
MEKYVKLAKRLKIADAQLISPHDLHFDPRAVLKCLWGCDDPLAPGNIKCGYRGLSLDERKEIIGRYEHILLLHSQNVRLISTVSLRIEKEAFLDGYYFALALRACNLCSACAVLKGESCPTPHLIRPCEAGIGLDIYKTVRGLNLPIEVLPHKEAVPDRYGFVLLN